MRIVAVQRDRGKNDVRRSLAGNFEHLRQGVGGKPLFRPHRDDIRPTGGSKACEQAGILRRFVNIN